MSKTKVVAALPPLGKELIDDDRKGKYAPITVTDFQWRFQKFNIKAGQNRKAEQSYTKKDLLTGNSKEKSIAALFTKEPTGGAMPKVIEFIFAGKDDLADAKSAIHQASAMDVLKQLLAQGLISAYEASNEPNNP